MNYPVCNEPMTLINQDASYNRSENNKAYDRMRYVCRKDDTWAKIEIPHTTHLTAMKGTASGAGWR